MKAKVAILILLSLALAPRAFADPGVYFSVGGGALTFDDSIDRIKPKQVFARLGYDFNEYFGLGFETGLSLIEDEQDGVDWDVSTTFFFLKVALPLGDSLSIYGLIGPTNVEITGSAFGLAISADDNDTGTGFGIEMPGDRYSFFIDTIRYNDNDGVEVDALNFGVRSYF